MLTMHECSWATVRRRTKCQVAQARSKDLPQELNSQSAQDEDALIRLELIEQFLDFAQQAFHGPLANEGKLRLSILAEGGENRGQKLHLMLDFCNNIDSGHSCPAAVCCCKPPPRDSADGGTAKCRTIVIRSFSNREFFGKIDPAEWSPLLASLNKPCVVIYRILGVIVLIAQRIQRRRHTILLLWLVLPWVLKCPDHYTPLRRTTVSGSRGPRSASTRLANQNPKLR